MRQDTRNRLTKSRRPSTDLGKTTEQAELVSLWEYTERTPVDLT